MERYSKSFKDNDIFQSMSERRETLQDLCYVVEEYIEFYNNHRYQKKLKKMTSTVYRDHLPWAV